MSIENELAKTRITVLCVDDEINILKSLNRVLRKKDYQLLFAQSGAEALELLQQQRVHLLISDMKMPAMSGAQLLEQVSSLYPNTYRILLSGHSGIEPTLDAVNKDIIHSYLHKPWNNDELINIIEAGLKTIIRK